MRYLTAFFTVLTSILFLAVACSRQDYIVEEAGNFKIGWSSVDLTPGSPVQIRGMGRARVSEGVMDPIYATALAMESGDGPNSEKVIIIGCDLIAITDGTRYGSADNLRDNVRKLVSDAIPGISRERVMLHATHTHTAPEFGPGNDWEKIYGVKLDVMSPIETLEYLSRRIAQAAMQAWENREPGGISYGLGYAVVARNRIQTDLSGVSRKGGTANRPEFSHIEGYEDHSVKLLYTWDNMKNLTGVVINVHTDPQVTGGGHFISSDFWHETREIVRDRLGDNIHVLPQCSAAGDQGTLVLVGARAERRMQEIKYPLPEVEEELRRGMGRRKQVATRVADAVTSVFLYMEDHVDWDPVLYHRLEVVELTRAHISNEVAVNARESAEKSRKQYEELLQKLKQNPAIKENPRWYRDISAIYSRMNSDIRVLEKYELQKNKVKFPVEVHVIRIGDIAIATNPFELYLDYATRIKARSPAIQTFVIQLAGDAAYLPTSRAVEGGTYGATPRTTWVGPEGGQELVEKTLEMINDFWGN